MKSVKLLSALVLGVIVIGGIFVYLNFADLAKRAAEKIASNALGVDVAISSLDISLKDKKAVLSGLRIDNPPGYKKPYIITADRINIGLKTASKELIDFDDISVDGVVVNFEATPNGTNLTDLKKLTQAKEQRESVGSEQVRVIVRKMVVNTSTLNPSVTLLNKDIGSISIPPVHISGIGTKTNGALAKDAVSQILVQYLGAAERASSQAGLLNADSIKSNFGEAVDDATKDIKKDIKKLFD